MQEFTPSWEHSSNHSHNEICRKRNDGFILSKSSSFRIPNPEVHHVSGRFLLPNVDSNNLKRAG
jgi:hypothetical protein